MRVVVSAVLADVFMIVVGTTAWMLVVVRMHMLMWVSVGVFVLMLVHRSAVLMLVGMSMGMTMLMEMGMFVLAFHLALLPSLRDRPWTLFYPSAV